MTKKKFLTGAEILAIKDLKEESVFIPQWETCVYVRALTGTERDKFESDSVTIKGKKVKANMVNIRARLVALSVVNGGGTRLFSDKDVTELGEKNAAALDLIFAVAQRLSGIGQKDVEDLAGN